MNKVQKTLFNNIIKVPQCTFTIYKKCIRYFLSQLSCKSKACLKINTSNMNRLKQPIHRLEAIFMS